MSETAKKALSTLEHAIKVCRDLEAQNRELKKTIVEVVDDMSKIRELERMLLLEPCPN